MAREKTALARPVVVAIHVPPESVDLKTWPAPVPA
jgi:hypothetical protein